MKKAPAAFLLCICLLLSLVGCTTRAAVARGPGGVTLSSQNGEDATLSLPAGELTPAPSTSPTPKDEAMGEGVFSLFKKTATHNTSTQPAEVKPADGSVDGIEDSATGAPEEGLASVISSGYAVAEGGSASPGSTNGAAPTAGATASATAKSTARATASATAKSTAGATPTAAARSTAKATTAPTPKPTATTKPTASASGGLTAQDIADILNDAFKEDGIDEVAEAKVEDDCIIVTEKIPLSYKDYMDAVTNDPNGDMAVEVTQFLSEETLSWTELFNDIVEESGYTGQFSVKYVFSDGGEYEGIPPTEF